MGRIAQVVFGDPHGLPPTLNTARVLARRGWKVDLLGVRWRGQTRMDDALPPEVTVHADQEVGTGLVHVGGYLRFWARAARFAQRERPDWVVAYDCMAAPVGRMMARVAGARFIYHCHDLARPEEISRAQRWMRVIPREHAAARAAELVVFPQADRARRFAAEAGLEAQPTLVFNCPPRDWLDEPAAEDTQMAEHRRRWPHVILYQGGLTRDRGVASLIESLPRWPSAAGLVLIGDPTTADVPALKARAEVLGVAQRILWRWLPYHQLPTIGRTAAIGVLLTPGANFNLSHLAGASNKVFEYMACGLPVLVPDTAGFRELIETPGHGEICRDSSAAGLADQITALLLDEPRRRTMSSRNREAFLERYNYEHQLTEVLKVLENR